MVESSARRPSTVRRSIRNTKRKTEEAHNAYTSRLLLYYVHLLLGDVDLHYRFQLANLG